MELHLQYICHLLKNENNPSQVGLFYWKNKLHFCSSKYIPVNTCFLMIIFILSISQNVMFKSMKIIATK